MNDISYKYKSFSGTDALVFVLLPNSQPILLGSLTTLSWSVYRNKRQVNVIGKINTSGVAKGIRVVAGTMVFTTISEHFVERLKAEIPSLNHSRLKADELPLFDLMIICGNEYGASISSTIYGVSFTEEGGVISVEDLFIENTCKYIARDIDNFEDFYNTTSNNYTKTLECYSLNEYSVNINDFINDDNSIRLLNNIGINVTNNDNSNNRRLISEFQSRNNLVPTGYINYNTRKLLNSINSCKIMNHKIIPVNIYDNPTDLNVIGKLYAFDTIDSYTVIGDYIKTDEGYIKKNKLIVEEPFIVNKGIDDNEFVFDINNPNYDNTYIKLSNISTNINIKYSINKIFDNKCISHCKQLTTSTDNVIINLREFEDLLIYDIKYGFPKCIELLVYPIGYTPIKTIINIRSDIT